MLLRFVFYAFQHFYRHFWLSLVTVTLMTLSLISITFLIILNALGNQALVKIKEKIDLNIYLKPEATKIEIEELKAEIETFPQTSEIKYVSPEKALEIFKQRHRDNPLLMESLKELKKNPLGATLIVKARTLEDYPLLLKNLEKLSYNRLIQEKEKDYEEAQLLINKLSIFIKKAKQISLLISFIFLIIVSLVVFNAIQIAIYTYRDEISIMRLVGASSFFIRIPFLLEVIFCVFISWAITLIIFWPFLIFIQPYLQEFLDLKEFDLLEYFRNNFFSVFGFQLGLLILLTSLSSNLAMRKYLKV